MHGFATAGTICGMRGGCRELSRPRVQPVEVSAPPEDAGIRSQQSVSCQGGTHDDAVGRVGVKVGQGVGAKEQARSVAVATGGKIVGTAGVLLDAYLGAHLDLEELEAVLQDLVQVLWVSPTVVAELLRLAREARI